MSTIEEPHRPRLAGRLLVWLVIVVSAGATGLFWAGQREQRSVDATVRLSLAGELDASGTLHVTEEVVVQTLGGTAVQRVLVTPGGVRWAGVSDGTGRALRHTTVEVPEGLVVTVPLEEAPSVLRLRYDLIGVAAAGMDAAELVWPIVDDRNPLAVTGLEVDATWPGDGPAEIVDVEAPGTATTVVPRAGGVRVEAGSLPAHHVVELHAAIPREAVADGMVEQRSVLAEMAVPPSRRPAAGGGPVWPPLLVSLLFLAVWAAVHRTHGREPDPGPPAEVGTPPGPQSPAEVAWLLRRGAVRQQDLVATLVDLAERGVIALQPRAWTLVGASDGLQPHERVLVDWLFAGGPVVDPAARTSAIRGAPSAWRDLRRAFVAAVEGAGRGSGLVERTVDAESVLGGGVAAASMVVLGVVGTALGQPLWLVCVAVGALAVVLVDTFARRSPEGSVLAARWLAFGTHLRRRPDAVEGHRAHGLVLGVPAAATSTTDAVTAAVAGFEDAYVTSTSYLAGPGRLPWGRRSGRGPIPGPQDDPRTADDGASV